MEHARTFLASLAVAGAAALHAGPAAAVDVVVSGLFTNKAVVQVDGGPLRTLAIGESTPEGVKLVAVERDAAVLEIDGQRTTRGLGQARLGRAAPAVQSAVLTADLAGHFSADGSINGKPVRFLVDTGATVTALPAAEARRLGLDLAKSEPVLLRTANGTARARKIVLDAVTVGGVTLYGVETVVMEGDGLTMPLLGMSFLNRMDMKREGSVLTLTKRY
ncbi:MAG: TIGR02281 family clan AA aspartic protease [Burkholderiales bacterium]